LPYATFVFNTTPHTATGYNPHELLFGRKPNIPSMLQKDPPATQYTYDNYVKELVTTTVKLSGGKSQLRITKRTQQGIP